MGCQIWEAAAGTYEEKVETKVCNGCRVCDGKPPKPSAESSDDEDQIDEIIADIEDIIEWENGGFATDWSAYSFEIKYLVRIWRNCELEIKRRRAEWLHIYIKAQFKE